MAIQKQKIITGEYWHPQTITIVQGRVVIVYGLYESKAIFEAGGARPITHERTVLQSPAVVQKLQDLIQAAEAEVIGSSTKLGGGIAVPDAAKPVENIGR